MVVVVGEAEEVVVVAGVGGADSEFFIFFFGCAKWRFVSLVEFSSFRWFLPTVHDHGCHRSLFSAGIFLSISGQMKTALLSFGFCLNRD